jgi:hypothetical protein
MAATMAVRMSRIEERSEPPEVARCESDLERRYQALLALVLRTGAWLSDNEPGLEGTAWEGAFAEYRENLRALKALGNELRPTTLRDDQELLAGRELAAETAERFAA